MHGDEFRLKIPLHCKTVHRYRIAFPFETTRFKAIHMNLHIIGAIIKPIRHINTTNLINIFLILQGSWRVESLLGSTIITILTILFIFLKWNDPLRAFDLCNTIVKNLSTTIIAALTCHIIFLSENLATTLRTYKKIAFIFLFMQTFIGKFRYRKCAGTTFAFHFLFINIEG